MKHNKCFVCDDKNIVKLGNYYIVHGLVKCSKCKFIFNEKVPSLEELSSHYAKYSYDSKGYLSPITIKSYNVLLDEMEKYRKSNKILDVGCGRGWFLDEARKRGWKVYGTEYSEKAIEICEMSGIEMKKGQLNADLFESESFDIVTSFEVIEHINNPNDDLKEVYKLLRKGGLYYCTTPNFNSAMRYYLKEKYNVIDYPEHLSYYTKKTLNKVLVQNNFKKVKFLSTGISVTRIRKSKNKSNEKFVSKESADEKLRVSIEQRWYLKITKIIINKILTLTNTGLSLKAYYIK